MKTITTTELRVNLSKILKEVEQGGHIRITSRGRIVASLAPPVIVEERAKERLKEIGKTAFIGDVMSPVDVPWNALSK